MGKDGNSVKEKMMKWIRGKGGREAGCGRKRQKPKERRGCCSAVDQKIRQRGSEPGAFAQYKVVKLETEAVMINIS